MVLLAVRWNALYPRAKCGSSGPGLAFMCPCELARRRTVALQHVPAGPLLLSVCRHEAQRTRGSSQGI